MSALSYFSWFHFLIEMHIVLSSVCLSVKQNSKLQRTPVVDLSITETGSYLASLGEELVKFQLLHAQSHSFPHLRVREKGTVCNDATCSLF